MFVTAIHARGFRDLPDGRIYGLDRLVDLQGPGPAATALGDAMELGFAALSVPALVRLLRRWGLLADGEAPEITGTPLPEQASWTDTETARALVADIGAPHLRVELTLALDPPLYGLLRTEAGRDPRVGTALGQGGELTLSVGALFTTTFDTLAVTVHDLRIGDAAFPTRAADRPHWMPRLLRALSTRFVRQDPSRSAVQTAASARSAMLGQTTYPAYEAWTQALQPDGPRLRVADGPGGRPMLLGDDLPLRRYGARAVQDAELAALVHLSDTDIVWAESDRRWLADAVTGDASVLEQVFRVHPGGTLQPEAADPPSRSPTRTLPTTLRESRLEPS